MIVQALAENTSGQAEIGAEHGLSLYVETPGHRLLFDTGASSLFYQNARIMGVNLNAADTLVVSHGHYDHGGGLWTFLHENGMAKVYIHENAFRDHYSRRSSGIAFIGLDKNLLPNDRFVFTKGIYPIDAELTIFPSVAADSTMDPSDENLLMREGDTFVPDDFRHEQNLLIRAEGKWLLLCGCAHAGILSILNRCREVAGRYPDAVVGGFHLTHAGSGTRASPERVRQIGQALARTCTKFWTCHCTGEQPFLELRSALGDTIQYLSAGDAIQI